jgi:transposase
MVYGAIDLHARKSQIRVIDGEGRVRRDRRVATAAAELCAAFQGLGEVRVLLESSTESEWVAQTLEAAGVSVIVADPNFAPMYGERQRQIKTDRRDVAALAEANRRGWYRPAYRRSAAQRTMQQRLRARRLLVGSRTQMISGVRAVLRQCGLRLGTGASADIGQRLARLTLPAPVAALLAPVARVVTTLTQEIAALDEQCAQAAADDAVVTRLQTVPGVGPVVALTFRAFIDDVTRFPHAGQVSAAMGLVPREDSSAERRHRGHITKAGPSELRSLLVQAAWACRHSRRSGPLRLWVDAVGARRGRRVAIVALARRLSRILYALWRDETEFSIATLAAA